MQQAINAVNITKKFGSKTVLNNISLTLDTGRITGILGPSGSGKTTLIRLMIGMLVPDSGKMTVLDRNIPDLNVLKDIGYMAQSDALYDDLSGYDNLIFFACVNGMDRKEARQNALKVLTLTGLLDDKDKPVRNYSGGMRRRLSLSIALIHDPSVLILDEPTVGIDPLLREVFWEEFRRRKETGRAVLVTTHVMDEAEKCDTLILIREGEIIAQGSPEELKEATGLDNIEKVFLYFSRKGGN